MICYAKNSIDEYLQGLASREPVPGGGSAAALSAAMGAALLAMSARYSMGKGRTPSIEKRLAKVITGADEARELFLTIVSRDAEAYLKIRAARMLGDKSALKAAKMAAARVPRELIKSCCSLLRDIPFMKKEGNRYLVSDVIAAEIFLNAAVAAAEAMVEANQ